MSYTAKDVDVDLYELNSENVDISTECQVKWNVSFESREWGIKSCDVVIEDIDLHIYWSKELDDEQSLIPVELKGNGQFKLDTSEFEIVEELEFDADGQLMVNSVEVYFTKKKIVVS